MLQIGGANMLGLSLSGLLSGRAASALDGIAPRADACIIVFLNGGPSHLDMWDMKPQATEKIRGEFQPISTSLPGYQMCELLPRLAGHAHRSTVVRSMNHTVNNAHAAAVYAALTGHDRGEIGGGARPDDNPAPGSVVGMLRPPEKPVVPHVTLPYITKEGATGPPQPGFFGGYLGHALDPLFVLKDPNDAEFSVEELSLTGDVSLSRLQSRRQLFAKLDHRLPRSGNGTALDAMDSFQSRAMDLLTSPASQRAFRVQDEKDALRESYGRNIYGQSALLARRLIEAGTRVVTLSWAPDANATWDTHGNNFKTLRTTLLPQLDAACGTLLDDLVQRGMFERTLVAIMGDFGRSPNVNDNAGRDHWNFCYSLMLAGGGISQGLVHGASDKIGAFPADNPLGPGDVVSTIYHLLGVDPHREMRDRLNRPHRLVPSGNIVADLIG
jgi:hypothetical protein